MWIFLFLVSNRREVLPGQSLHKHRIKLFATLGYKDVEQLARIPRPLHSKEVSPDFKIFFKRINSLLPNRDNSLLPPLTGVDIRLPGADCLEVNALRGKAVQEEVRQQVTLPEFVMDGMTAERNALQRAGIAETTRCECIVQGALTVAALHEPARLPALWNSSLRVWKNDALVYADTLEEGVEKPGLNNFLIRSDKLYYLKGREELLCVALS